MLYSTPVFLGFSGYDCRIIQQAVCIAAISAVDFFDEIQVFKPVPVYPDVVFPPNKIYSIQPEADMMVDFYGYVKNNQRKNQYIDKWC